MKHTMKTKLNAYDFCGEKAREAINGRINFRKYDVIKFLSEYTHAEYTDFNADQIQLIKFWMIDLYEISIRRQHSIPTDANEKLEIPLHIYR